MESEQSEKKSPASKSSKCNLALVHVIKHELKD